MQHVGRDQNGVIIADEEADLTGRMADMKAVNEIAERHNLFVIEDAAQSIGSMVDERLSGAWGHVGCFSTIIQMNYFIIL